MHINLQILILAAGKGQRMGSTKQLLPYENATLLGSVISLANSLGWGKPMVILGYQAEKIKLAVKQNQADITVNPEWEQGMGKTIAHGIKRASTINPDLNAVLVMLADQPRISKSHLLQLINEYQKNRSPIVATAYPNGGGVPAVFDSAMFTELMNLEGDKGARQLIRNHKGSSLLVPTKDEVCDIDTPEDYQKLVDKK